MGLGKVKFGSLVSSHPYKAVSLSRWQCRPLPAL
ncbi:unnamed protein product [Brassica oleracea var. botrytis]